MDGVLGPLPVPRPARPRLTFEALELELARLYQLLAPANHELLLIDERMRRIRGPGVIGPPSDDGPIKILGPAR